MNLKEILEELYAEHGELTPEIVRDAARPDDSPLHAYVYDRDRNDAAEAYYLERAHRLIQRCRVVMTESDDGPPRRVRAWWAVPSETGYLYEPHSVLVNAPDKAAAAKQEAFRRVEQAQVAVDDLDFILFHSGQPAPGPKRALRALKRAAKELQV